MTDRALVNRASSEDWPFVTVVVLGYNGKQHLAKCLPTLLEQTYPRDRLELLVVDNASVDGTAEYVEEHYPSIRVHRSNRNLGFAGGNNLGAQVARGRYVAFLNQDTRVRADWLEELVRPIVADQRQGDGRLACVGSKIVSWDGATIDFAGSRLNFIGMGAQEGFRQPDDGQYDQERPMLFACGGSMVIDRAVFLEAGGFDEDFFLFFEDVDLGWRLWVLGYRVQLAPKAVTYHRLHGSTGELEHAAKRLLYQRNSAFTILKNYDDVNLGRALPASLLLTMQQALAEVEQAGASRDQYDLGRDTSQLPPVPVPAFTVSLLMSLRDVVDKLPAMMAKRAAIQARRRRPDAEILNLFHGAFEPLAHGVGYAEASYQMVHDLKIAESFAAKPRHVLLFSNDILPFPGLPATGAGLRAWGLAKGLEARGHTVTYALHQVVVDYAGAELPDTLRATAWDEQTITDMVARVSPDVILCCSWYPAIWLRVDRHPVIVDQHGPHMLERSFHKDIVVDFVEGARRKLRALGNADYFTCAGERQHHYFEPWLMQAGFDLADPAQQPGVIPVSLSPDLPTHHPEGETTFVYGGVFLPWQDPALGLTTLVETMEAKGAGRLSMFGGGHPIFREVGVSDFPRLQARLERSPRVTIHPFVARDDLLKHYARAHVAIDLMRRNPERELAFTTRTVEYLWCGLPVIYNNYSELSDYIREYEAGWTLDPDDVDGLRAVIEQILAAPILVDERSRNAQRLVRERLTWDKTIDPIDAFVRRPTIRRKVPDFLARLDEAEATGQPAAEPPVVLPPPVAELPAGLRPLLEREAARRRSPGARLVNGAKSLVKRLLGVGGPVLQDGRLVQALPELVGSRTEAQTFVAEADGLTAIALRFGTFGRVNTRDVTVRLYEEDQREPVVVVSTNAGLLVDGHYRDFRFPPRRRSGAKRYRFQVESPASVPGDAVCLWCEVQSGASGEQHLQDGQPAAGRLAYRAIYQ